MEIKMTFPHRLKLALFFICCMQHVYASTSSVTASKSSMSAAADSSMITQANSSTTAVAPTSTMSSGYHATSTGRANTTGAQMTATVSAASEAPATATVIPTSTTHNTTMSASAYVNNASAHVLTSSSMSTAPNASFSIGTEYSSPDCISCSIGGTITVTMSCSIKMPSNDDKKCDKDEFNKTRCGTVILANEEYSCADVKKNFTYYEKKHLKPVKQCGDVCPTSGSVLSAQLVFIFSSGIAVSLLSQTL